MHRQIAGKLTGPVTKWIVLVVVLVAAAGLGSFAGKLLSVQDNEMSSWLPESAESTRALEKLGDLQDPNDMGTTVVYFNEDGLTDAQLAAIEQHAVEIEEIKGVTDVLPRERRCRRTSLRTRRSRSSTSRSTAATRSGTTCPTSPTRSAS
jgi:putative drug exporter of the RND superfamily